MYELSLFSSRMRNIDWRDFELIHGHEKICWHLYKDMGEIKYKIHTYFIGDPFINALTFKRFFFR